MRGIPHTSAAILTSTVCEIPLSAHNLLRALLSLSPHRRLSILDSCGARDSSSRFLIAGFDPFEIVEAHGNQISITRNGESQTHVMRGDALNALDERLVEYVSPRLSVSHLPAAGACIAIFSYELSNQLERLRSRQHVSVEPDVVLAFYDTLVIHDYQSETTKIVSVGEPQR